MPFLLARSAKCCVARTLTSQERVGLSSTPGSLAILARWITVSISSKSDSSISLMSFFCNFKFRSVFLRLFTSFFLEGAVEKMVDAFEKKLNSTY